MKKMLVTVALAAAVVSSFVAGSPARADDAPQVMPQLINPDIKDLTLKPAPQILQHLLIIRKAELTSQLFVFHGYHPVFNPYPQPYKPVVWCYVKNSGLKDSGWFKTLIRFHLNGLPYALQGYIPMNIKAGGHQWVGFRIFAPYGLKRVFSYADATYLVPEYVETNNWDSVP